MKFTPILIIILLLSAAAFAQKPTDILATATGRTFKLNELSSEARGAVEKLPAETATIRSGLLDQMLSMRAIEIEAASRGISAGKLIALEKAKAPAPAEADIRAAYDANREALGTQTLEQARKRIVAYLRGGPEQKLLGALFTQLSTKYKLAKGKDVNAVRLLPTDVVGTVNGVPITAKQFEDYARVELFELRADLADFVLQDLNVSVLNTLIADEAKSLGIDAGTLLAREITNKMKDFTDAERVGLETALRKRLWTKYQVKVLFKPPTPPAEVVSLDDDPAQGPLTAPVKVVMFSDFQCSACAAVYPLLKKTIAAYPGRVRFIVRDFPLESIHTEAFDAARAAGAANAQGKFFEYTEILYKNQDALDPASLKKYAAQIGLNAAKFDIDFNSALVAAEVRKDLADAESYRITSTPTIFVNGVRMRYLSDEDLRAAIDRALAKP
jgi:protein-disulfide isomerase